MLRALMTAYIAGRLVFLLLLPESFLCQNQNEEIYVMTSKKGKKSPRPKSDSIQQSLTLLAGVFTTIPRNSRWNSHDFVQPVSAGCNCSYMIMCKVLEVQAWRARRPAVNMTVAR